MDEDAPLRVDPMDLMAKLRVSTPAQERKCLGMDLRSPDLGPSRSAQLSGPRNLKEAFDAQPAGRGAELVLRSAADDGPFAFGPDSVDDGPVRGDWDVLEFDLRLLVRWWQPCLRQPGRP